MKKVTRWRLGIPEPKYESVIFAFAYMIFTVTGVATVILPPQTIEGILGSAAMSSVGWFFLIGGVTGMATGWAGWWEWERWAIGLITGGLIIYLSIVAGLHVLEDGSRLTQIGVHLVAGATLALRFGKIVHFPFQPREVIDDAD